MTAWPNPTNTCQPAICPQAFNANCWPIVSLLRTAAHNMIAHTCAACAGGFSSQSARTVGSSMVSGSANNASNAAPKKPARQANCTDMSRLPAPSSDVTAGSNAPTSAFASASVWYWTWVDTPYAAFAVAPKKRFVTNALPCAPTIQPPVPNTDQPAKDKRDLMRPPVPRGARG